MVDLNKFFICDTGKKVFFMNSSIHRQRYENGAKQEGIFFFFLEFTNLFSFFQFIFSFYFVNETLNRLKKKIIPEILFLLEDGHLSLHC